MMSRAANLKNSDFKSRFPESLAATQLASHVEVEHEVKLSENRRAVTVIHHPGRRGVTVTPGDRRGSRDRDRHRDCQ